MTETLASALEEGFKEFLENYDFSDIVSNSLPDFSDEVQKVVDDYDFSDAIHSAVRDYDWWDEIGEKAEDEIQEKVNEAVEEQLERWVKSHACKELMREVLIQVIKDEVRGYWNGIKAWFRGVAEEVVLSFGHIRGERF